MKTIASKVQPLLAYTDYLRQCPSVAVSLPTPLHRLLMRAADRRAEGPDPHFRAAMVRRLLSAAVETYLLSIGERHEPDIAAVIEREARDGTLAEIPSPELAAKRRDAIVQSRAAEERDVLRRKSAEKLHELCARVAAINTAKITPAEVELLAVNAPPAGFTFDEALKKAGLSRKHWAVTGYLSTRDAEPTAAK